MFSSFLKFILFLFTRPLALYMIYPGSVGFLMKDALKDAETLEISLVKKGGESVLLTTRDKRKIEAMYFPNRKWQESQNSSHPTVLLCLGNRMLFQQASRYVEFYLAYGLNVIAFNYGGYGKSEGKPSTESTFEDIETVYQYIKTKKNISDEHILVHGLSLGGGPASYLASKYPIHLLLDKTFSKIGQASKIRLLGIIADYLYPYDNASRIKNIKGRIHIIEALEDEIIHTKNTETLFKEIIVNRHPKANDFEIKKLQKKYITRIQGSHKTCILSEKYHNTPPQEHFIEEVVLPMTRKK